MEAKKYWYCQKYPLDTLLQFMMKKLAIKEHCATNSQISHFRDWINYGKQHFWILNFFLGNHLSIEN